MSLPSLPNALQQYFGFTSFRPGQEEVIRNLLAGRHTLVVMPTGAGKSLIYQLAALLLPGTALVISPLIALMKDQVDNLTRRGIPATAINSTVPSDEQDRRLEAMQRGKYRLVYLAPERLRDSRFCKALVRTKVSLLAVDEAHCISQWGHDFRPDYLHIATVREVMGNPTTIALTATATPQVQNDILKHLKMPDAERIVTGFNRANLAFRVCYTPELPDKYLALWDFLAENSGPGIIYVGTRYDSEEVADFVRDVLGRDAQAYHAGLEDGLRAETQGAFMAGQLNLVVATNAFGMGVDRADVRFVLHFSLPGTLEAYYQEAGRAGRDGKPAQCVLLYAPQDRALQEWFIENDAPSPQELEILYQVVRERVREGVAVLTLDDLALATGIREVRLRVGLSLLEQMGTLHRLGDEGLHIWLEVGTWRPERLRVTADEINTRRDHKRRQLALMATYAETDTCRRRLILEHFGDQSSADADICCDNCLATSRIDLPTGLPEFESLPRESRIALGILDTVRRLSWPVGQSKLAGVLKGSRAKDILDQGYDKAAYYGRLSKLTLEEIGTLIRQLVKQGYLKIVGSDRPVVQLTPQGKQALARREAIPLQLNSRMRSDTPEMDADEKSLFEELRAWRKEVARGKGSPAFVIFHDSTLREIALHCPMTLEELLDIKGIGPRKVEEYGNSVISIIYKHKETSGRREEQRQDVIKTFLSRPHPRPLRDSWQVGWALDHHSRFAGSDRHLTGVGDLTRRLKYRGERGLVGILVDHLQTLIQDHPGLARVDAIIPVPPSTPRSNDPVHALATALGKRLGLPVQPEWLLKTRATRPQKEMRTRAQKQANVKGAFAVQGSVRSLRLLVLDDLYDSGETLKEVTRVLKRAGAAVVMVLTLTKTIHSDA